MDDEKHIEIDGSMTVHGDVVFGDQIKNFAQERPRPVIVVPAPKGKKRGWQGGVEVTVGSHAYLLDGRLLTERISVDVVHREARALQCGRRRSGYVWLRQVEVREPTAAAQRVMDALLYERDLLRALSGDEGIPRVREYEGGRTATLAVTWPSTRSGPRPTLGAMLDPEPGPLGEYMMFRLFGGLAGLCTTLAVLHGRGLSHRCLSATGIIETGGDGLMLRDLGLAAHAPGAGESPAMYPAPEQRMRRAQDSGPHTDAYQMAALAYHLLTGRPPASRAPLPVGRQVLGLPEPVGRVIDAGLTLDPSLRPDVRSLGAAFWNARDDLSRGNDAVSSYPPPRSPHPHSE